ncbi:VTT domain-containing protein [Halorarum halophilum]|uniref:VTT domain-containing protein n=1 Tax=Halorarum halophilum TaxID=2743090 RepID=A0A7D5GM21_9EURY|nr:VTT domain-containing protein [Halobaculum halophilum]QLG28364.1 VTT domain-containing protein [Halobaculum halophilum]
MGVPVPLQNIVGEFPPWFQDLVGSEYAYLFLFGVFVLEGAMLMYFVPSELIVPGSLVLLGHGPDRVVAIIGVAVLGATVGQYALFKLAERGGREWLLKKRWFRVSEDTLDRFDGWFDRWGPVVVPVSNSLLFTRGMLTVPAGLAEMDDRKFVLLSAVGTLCFEAALAGLYLFGVDLLW